MPDRHAIILGAMKCGTTTLYEHLVRHPQVCACAVKEPDFFSDDKQFQRGIEQYAKLWDFDTGVHRVALESSTSYTMHPRVPCPAARIAQLDADVRFIYIMRDPVARIESEIRHEIGNGRWHPDQPIDTVPPEMIAVSNYAMQLDPYRQRFGRDKLLLLSFNDLREKPAELLKRVCAFLDVDSAFNFPAPDHVANPARNYNPMYFRLAQIPGLPWLARHSPLGPRKVIRKILARPVSPDVRLNDEQRAQVLEELRPAFERLKGEYGFDAPGWHICDA